MLQLIGVAYQVVVLLLCRLTIATPDTFIKTVRDRLQITV